MNCPLHVKDITSSAAVGVLGTRSLVLGEWNERLSCAAVHMLYGSVVLKIEMSKAVNFVDHSAFLPMPFASEGIENPRDFQSLLLLRLERN